MSNFLNSAFGGAKAAFDCRRAVAAVEFALLAPLLALVMVGIFDFGYFLNQSNDLTKSLRVGAMLAARSSLPIPNSLQTTINNLVKTGTTDGSGEFIIPGWSHADADLSVATSTFSSGGTDFKVIRLVASVPYEAYFSGFLQTYGFNTITMNAAHEQAFVGD